MTAKRISIAVLPAIAGTVWAFVLNYFVLDRILIPDPCYYHSHETSSVFDLFFEMESSDGYHPFPTTFNFIVTVNIGAMCGLTYSYFKLRKVGDTVSTNSFEHMDKTVLDNILEKHRAQPVGDGYIDIIVSRDNYEEFVSDLVTNDFRIEGISWWEWCIEGSESKYGLGGPESIFYDGWYAEISAHVDDIDMSESKSHVETIRKILEVIESKTISFSGETVAFRESNWLTPAIWLDVPKTWRNKH